MTRLSARIFAPEKLVVLADVLDSRFKLPCIPIRFGWDFIIGLVPVAGDALTALVSVYLIVAAVHHRTGIATVLRMLFNVLFDFVIGLAPVVGDLFDAGWKSNLRNVRLLMQAIDKKNS